MSYGPVPGEEHGYPAQTTPQDFGGLPPYPGQAEPAGPPGWAQGQVPPPGYGQPTYGQPGYGPPTYPPYPQSAYGQPGYGPPIYGQPMYPQPGYGPPIYGQPGPQPPTYRAWGVTATVSGVLFSLLLGLPTAIVGVTYGSKVTKAWASGDVQGAYNASRKARGWLTASTVFDAIGFVVVVLLLALTVTHGSGAPASFNPSGTFSTPLQEQQEQIQSGVGQTPIQEQMEQRLVSQSDPFPSAPGLTIKSVICRPAGPDSQTCTWTTSDGQTKTLTIPSVNPASLSSPSP
jgi:hypothetical protein